jgi:cytochrome b involved in lipid metabolism
VGRLDDSSPNDQHNSPTLSGSVAPSDKGRPSALPSSKPSIAPSSTGGNSNNGSGESTIDCVINPHYVTMEDLARHNTASDCCIGLHGHVFNLTDYAQSHPGGARVISDLAGIDGTSEYQAFHSQGLLALVQGTLAGRLDGS